MTYVLLFVVLWTVAVFTEVTIAAVSLRGTIYNDRERAAAEYLLYARLGEEARITYSVAIAITIGAVGRFSTLTSEAS